MGVLGAWDKIPRPGVAVHGSGQDDQPESCGKDPMSTWQWSVLSGFGR
jgi:hypothetical protein